MCSVKDLAALLFVLCSIVAGSAAQQTFQYCLRAQPRPGLLECAGRQALTSLSAIQEADNFTIDSGFVMIREGTESLSSRALPSFLDQDPTDFRGMLENAGAIVGQRSLQWDLSALQPGLCLRIGPSPESTSMLEFVMDPRHDRGDRYINEEPPSAARTLAKQFVVPFLLGLKFNLLTILPLFFGVIILLCKKAAFLGKMALFVTGLLGYSSAFSLGGLGGLFGGGGFGGFGSGGGWPVAGGIGARPPFLNDVNVNVQADYPGYYKGYGDDYRRQEKKLTYPASTTSAMPAGDMMSDNFYEYEKKVMQQDRHAPIEYEQADAELEATKGFRSFAWSTTT